VKPFNEEPFTLSILTFSGQPRSLQNAPKVSKKKMEKKMGTVRILVKILPIANNFPMCYIDDRKEKVFFQDNNGKE